MSLLLAIIGHLVGDYLLQNDWMALNKKAHSFPCAVHCLIWATCVIGWSGWAFIGWDAIPVFALLFGLHYAQDRTKIINRYMTLIGQEQFAKQPMAPWSIVVVDNVWHIVTLVVIWRFMMGGRVYEQIQDAASLMRVIQ